MSRSAVFSEMTVYGRRREPLGHHRADQQLGERRVFGIEPEVARAHVFDAGDDVPRFVGGDRIELGAPPRPDDGEEHHHSDCQQRDGP
jgi:hypothetical protein